MTRLIRAQEVEEPSGGAGADFKENWCRTVQGYLTELLLAPQRLPLEETNRGHRRE